MYTYYSIKCGHNVLYTAGVSCSLDLLYSTLSRELSHEFAVDLRSPAKALHLVSPCRQEPVITIQLLITVYTGHNIQS